MRHLTVRATALAAALFGASALVHGASADVSQCADGLPFEAKACVHTTNSGGEDGDVHRVDVVVFQQLPLVAMGLSPSVQCDDDGGTRDGEVSANIGPEAAIAVPGPCPDLP